MERDSRNVILRAIKNDPFTTEEMCRVHQIFQRYCWNLTMGYAATVISYAILLSRLCADIAPDIN